MVIVPLEHLWVEANLRETELRDVRPGQSATVTVDLHGRKQTYHGTVEGLVPGTGSAFALLPPDNATGNFIHIVERVPVRIALPIEEIRKYPLRPGLSTVTQIDVSAVGQSVWSSLATVSTEEYQTDVYADELTTAGSLAEDVILSNVVSKEHRVKAEQWRENHLATLVPLERRPQDRANRPAIVPAAEATMERHARQPEVEQRVDMAVIE
jgi:membrane fusion protein (multidrug efflux system)